MFYLTSVTEFGEVIQCAATQYEHAIAGGAHPDAFATIPNEAPNNTYWNFVTEAWDVIPTKPSNIHMFDWYTKQWVDPRTLTDVKATCRESINTERLKANQSYFTHMGKQIAADPLSRSDIDAINGEIANTGMFPAGWPGAWKCEDNTWLPIATVNDWKALYTAMVNQGTANFAHSQTLKAQIDSATTIAEVEAITWEML